MPIIDLQRRLREVGRIRIGVRIPTTNGKSRPSKLDTFRLTSQDRDVLETAARIFGGTVTVWPDAPNGEQWELITQTATLPIVIPPGGVSMTQHYELWSGGGCKRRCDGAHEMISDGDCVCDPEQRECTPHTRLSVMIRDLPGLGVWRLDTQGFYAAVELAGAVGLVEWAAQGGRMLPARLRLEQRSVKREGEQVKRFAVPVIDLDVTIASLAGTTPQPVELSAEVVELEPPKFTAIQNLPEAPVEAVAVQVAEAGKRIPAKRRVNAAEPLPATGLQPRTAQAHDEVFAGSVSVGSSVGQVMEKLVTRAAVVNVSLPPFPDEEAHDGPSDAQIRKLMATYNGLGIKDRADQKRITCELLDLEHLESHKDLTGAQTSILIDMLVALTPADIVCGPGTDGRPYIAGSEPGA